MGKRSVFVVPGQAAPIVTAGAANYDMSARRIAGTGVRTSIESEGQQLFISGERYVAVALRDSVRSANDINYYFKNGIVTACDDSIPDYYFKAKEIKRTGSFVVGRPAVLYIGDVPVMWLPFVFQDVRGGRHSGILPPNVGVSDIVRNSPSYRRNVEGLGYYWAMSDYVDAQAFFDWRSSAGQTEQGDPGFIRYNGEMRYRWLDRFVAGNLAFSQTTQGNARNTAVTWGHQQSFTKNSSLSANINYATNTILQRETTSNPYSALATISSTANYQQKIGPAQFSLGGTNRQYPGRSQVDRSFPTLSISTSPLSLGSWLTWTPNFSYSASADAEHRPAVGARAVRAPGDHRRPRHGPRRHAQEELVHEQSLVRHAAHDLRLQPRQPVHDQLGAQRLSRAGHRRRRRDGRGAGAHLRADVQHRGGLDARRSRCRRWAGTSST